MSSMADDYFLKIHNPVAMRRNILESSQLLLHNLRAYQRVLDLREERERQVEVLRRQVKEITMLCDKAQQIAPEAKLRALMAEAPDELKQRLADILERRAERPRPEEQAHDEVGHEAAASEVEHGSSEAAEHEGEHGSSEVAEHEGEHGSDLRELTAALRDVKQELRGLE